jgi:hypothetical protein
MATATGYSNGVPAAARDDAVQRCAVRREVVYASSASASANSAPLLVVGRFVDPIQRRHAGPGHPACHGPVGQQHEFLNHE